MRGQRTFPTAYGLRRAPAEFLYRRLRVRDAFVRDYLLVGGEEALYFAAIDFDWTGRGLLGGCESCAESGQGEELDSRHGVSAAKANTAVEFGSKSSDCIAHRWEPRCSG